MSRKRFFLLFVAFMLLGVFPVLAVPDAADGAADRVGGVDPTQGLWHLRGESGVTTFYYGNPGDYPILGDWDCDGVQTPGMYRQSDGYVYLRDSNTQGVADIRFFFGNPGDVPIVGDFNGNGCDTVSIYRPAEGRVFIINELGKDEGGLGQAELDYYFGDPGDKPFVGDFDGDGVDTVGLHRESTGLVYFRNSHTQGVADNEFIFGDPGDRLVAGDWNDNGIDSPALFRPANTTWYFRYTNTQGVADEEIVWGESTWLPVAGAERARDVDLKILAINDFHGNIDSSFGTYGGSGGAQYLATHLRGAAATASNSIIVSVGDLIGASPLVSALFHDEPTIEAANLLGLELNAAGNHEFDEGTAELLRMQEGGPHPVDGDLDGDPYAGADFQFLAANVIRDATGETLFPPYVVKHYQGVPVAFIGLTLEGTPSIVTPSAVAGLTFQDEVDTLNALVPELEKQNVAAIVVLIHQGGAQSLGGGEDDCNGIAGPIVDIVNGTDDAVDLFITGHTHQGYLCEIDGRTVTGARSYGRLYTDINVTLNSASRDLSVVAVDNVPVTRDVAPAADVQALIDKYDALSAPLADRVIGTISADVTRTSNAAGESALGDVIADAQLAATAPAGFGDAVVAFMNPGGIRADLTYLTGGSEADGEVTYGEAFTVQPFGNSLVTMTLSGAQIDTLLEQQFKNGARILQPSAGFTYEWSLAAPTGSKVDPGSIEIDGTPIDLAASYRVTVNSFLADGGDDFTVLTEGTSRLGGDLDLDALEAYFATNSPVPPGPQDRITMVP